MTTLIIVLIMKVDVSSKYINFNQEEYTKIYNFHNRTTGKIPYELHTLEHHQCFTLKLIITKKLSRALLHEIFAKSLISILF